MASLHLHPRSPYWQLSYKDQHGVWKSVSTKEKDRKLAERFAIKIEDAAKASSNGELTRVVATKILAEMVESSSGERLYDPSIRTFLNEWLAGKGATRTAGTAARYSPPVRGFLSSLGPRAEKSLRGVTASDIENYRTSQTEQGKSNGSANMDVNILKVAFDAAHKQGLILINPAKTLEALPADEESKQPFTLDQVQKLLDAAQESWKGMILFGSLAGLRLADAANLSWADVELAGASLNFRPMKTRRTRKTLHVALHSQIVEWLENHPATDKPNAPLFPSLKSTGTGGHGGLSNAFHRIMIKADVVPAQTRIKKGKGRGFSPLSFHSLRHTFVSNLANADVSQEIRKAVAGHTSDRAHERYTHMAVETQRRALLNLPSFILES